jgi:Calcium-dependent channel, 7TM region, putative phosphate
VYSCIAPLLIPFGILFFFFSYAMYKYQLLYVYVNDYQSGGDMWYDVFWRSLVGMIFATCTLLGYLMLQITITNQNAGPFIFMLPMPLCLIYFWRFCENKFRGKTQALTLVTHYRHNSQLLILSQHYPIHPHRISQRKLTFATRSFETRAKLCLTRSLLRGLSASQHCGSRLCIRYMQFPCLT